MKTIYKIAPLFGLSLLTACTTMPTGPSVMALPGTGKSFQQFRTDDYECRQYALAQVGGKTASQSAAESGVKSAAIGAAIGAAAGAIMGGHEGAGTGAGTGLLVGSLAGAGAADASASRTQRHYDNAYIQCMYAKGERVPVSGHFVASPVQSQPANIPPPPAGYPPPPPPGVSDR